MAKIIKFMAAAMLAAWAGHAAAQSSAITGGVVRIDQPGSAISIGNQFPSPSSPEPAPTAQGVNALAIGNGSAATAPDATALGSFASASAAGATAIGTRAVADQPNTISVGSAGAERRVVNVAPGTGANDAVVVAQLAAETTARAFADAQLGQRLTLEENGRAALASALAAETSSRAAADIALSSQLAATSALIDNLGGRVGRLEDHVASSTAVAVAMGGSAFLPDMRFNLTANVATYDGAHAGSVQLGALVTRNVALNAGVAAGFNKRGKAAGRVGVTFGW
jgi:hypothetical protein